VLAQPDEKLKRERAVLKWYDKHCLYERRNAIVSVYMFIYDQFNSNFFFLNPGVLIYVNFGKDLSFSS